jgi:uncharacterized membrane protein (UPF0182 family)
MRVPTDPPAAHVPRSARRYQVAILALLLGLIVLVIITQAGANFFTNYLWYRSVDLSMVWRSMIATKLELGAVFAGAMFIVTWLSLLVVDRIAPRALFMAPELELVRRYQSSIGRYRVTVRTVVSFLVGLAVGAGATGQWQHWLLYLHGGSFGATDPQFHKNVGFFVFKLPFLSFLVDWAQLALVVLFIVSVVAHYLNGGLRFSGPPPRIDPRTIAHLSAIVAAFALLRAVAYYTIDKYALDLSNNGVVTGAGYTDVHVRLPALELLAVVAIVTFGLLVFNIYQRSLLLPAIGVGLWAFLAIVIGVVFPAAVQWLEVTPAQTNYELPYIARNIEATQAAMGLTAVSARGFDSNEDLTGAVVDAPNNQPTVESVSYWDPGIAADTYQKQQNLKGYYSVSGLSADRYRLKTGSGRRLTPVVIGVREVVPNQVANPSWVNVHLEYTHGYGYVMSPANTWNQNGQPNYDAADLPPSESADAPTLGARNLDVYFGTGMNGYSVVDTKQPELDYVAPDGQPRTSHYEGSGGIPLGGFWTRAAFALRFHDFNLLVSKLITPQSRIMYLQDIRARVAHAAPFLRVDAHPYPVVADGQLWWLVDAYTTSSYYPYAQVANTSVLPSGSGLSGSFNYVRDSVKVVINAYSGTMRFYAVNGHDPILRAWESIYPGMFKPLSDMLPQLRQHLRYPQDLLMLQSAMFGRYHVAPSLASEFYNNSNTWSIAPQRFSVASPIRPIFELLRLWQRSLGFYDVEPMVPYSQNGRAQTMSAFLVASCANATYGHLTAYEIHSTTQQISSPARVFSSINENQAVSILVTKLDQHGSRVLWGPIIMLPIDDSIMFVETMYLTSTLNPVPVVKNVIVSYKDGVYLAPELLGSRGALAAVFGQSVSAIGSNGKANVNAAVRTLLADADREFAAAEKAIAKGDYTAWGIDLQKVGLDLREAHAYLSQSGTSSSSSTSQSSSLPSSSSSSSSSLSSGSSSTSRTGSGSGGSGVAGDSTTSTTASPPSGAAAVGEPPRWFAALQPNAA